MDWMDHRKITITTLSAIHIGCDEDFVPAEFVISDNILHYLDMAVVADALEASERNALGGMQTIGAIQQFFKSRRDRFIPLSTHWVEIASDIAKEYDEKAGKPTQSGMNGESTYNQFTLARTAYRMVDFSPYLPGSSLKGSMRTAWIDSINKGRTLEQSGVTGTVKNRQNRELQQKVLGYTNGNFQDDPLRHLRVADAHHGEESMAAPTRILYAVSKKKKPSERGAAELNVRLETIPGLLDDAFSGEISFTESKVIDNPVTWRRLCDACNNFYWPQLEGELGHAHLASVLDQNWRSLIKSLLTEELQALRENHQGFLLRVGRHSGAESMTLNGVRDIKILGKGDPPSYRSETTEKRFASQTKTAMDGLLPFGWVWVESCEDELQYVSAAVRDKLRPYSRTWRETQRDRLQQIEEAREARLTAAQAAEQRRMQAEEAERRRAREEQARLIVLESMSPNMRRVEELRTGIEKRLALGRKIPVSDQFYGQHIKALAHQALESADWSAEEKSALADMLQEWAGKLMALDAKDLRKQLKLASLRGQA